MSKTMTAGPVVEVYQTPNKKTKSGNPLRWRWRILDADGEQLGKGRHSFRTEDKALSDLERHAVVPDGTVLRRPGQKDRVLP